MNAYLTMNPLFDYRKAATAAIMQQIHTVNTGHFTAFEIKPNFLITPEVLSVQKLTSPPNTKILLTKICESKGYPNKRQWPPKSLFAYRM